MPLSPPLARRGLLSRREVLEKRRDMVPYAAHGLLVQPDGQRHRAAAFANLVDVVTLQAELATTCTTVDAHATALVLISVDATSLWKSSATRSDVCLVLPGDPRSPRSPSSWTTWFLLDGSDSAAALSAADRACGLNSQVDDLQRTWVLPWAAGVIRIAHCVLTADGKGMQAMHPGARFQCWNCNAKVADLSTPTTEPNVGPHVRFGAFLPAIPAHRRVGDVVHATSRVVNALFKRLVTQALPICPPPSEGTEGTGSGGASPTVAPL